MDKLAKDNRKDNPSQLLRFISDSYLDRTSRPIYALAYLLCFIIFYEVGTIVINPEILNRSLAGSQIRVVSFVWIQNLLEYIGFSPRMRWVSAPLAVIVILLALQITSRTRWTVRLKDFIPMTFECVLLAIPLIVLSLAINRTATASAVQTLQTPPQPPGLLVDIVTGIGAGIYEELIFRLILICLLMLLLQDVLKLSRTSSIIISVIISAVLFSFHHYLNEAFCVASFTFRTLAGIYFAVLFALRGFAVTAGSHAFYDIIAAVLNTVVLGPEN